MHASTADARSRDDCGSVAERAERLASILRGPRCDSCRIATPLRQVAPVDNSRQLLVTARAGDGPIVARALVMNRLETIASRQRRLRARDLVFACFMALVAAVGATTVGAAIDSSSVVVKR